MLDARQDIPPPRAAKKPTANIDQHAIQKRCNLKPPKFPELDDVGVEIRETQYLRVGEFSRRKITWFGRLAGASNQIIMYMNVGQAAKNNIMPCKTYNRAHQ